MKDILGSFHSPWVNEMSFSGGVGLFISGKML